MPADPPINLNKARKARAKADKRREADANAAKFGRTKEQREVDKARAGLEAARLDGHRRDE